MRVTNEMSNNKHLSKSRAIEAERHEMLGIYGLEAQKSFTGISLHAKVLIVGCTQLRLTSANQESEPQEVG